MSNDFSIFNLSNMPNYSHIQNTFKRRVKSFTCVKSNYILKEIFENLFFVKEMQIVSYNKNLQKRLDLSIKDYKDYYQVIIELEVHPKEKIKGYKNYFLKYIDSRLAKFYHIYFNNKNVEIHRNYYMPIDNVTKIHIIIDYEIKSFYGLFNNCDCIQKIKFLKFYRKDIMNMSCMFFNCNSLINLDLSIIQTDKVIDFSYMFSGCYNITNLELSKFKTDNSNNMSSMFNSCRSLNYLNIYSFNTKNVKSMKEMFSSCALLERKD